MTTISAKSILASRHSQTDKILHTDLLRYPWIIHSEGQTHRVLSLDEEIELYLKTPGIMHDRNLSKNAGSTRAIPVERMIQSILDDPFIPRHWGKNQRGMTADEELSPDEIAEARAIWTNNMHASIANARLLTEMGIHKQQVNRMLAPYTHITVVVSATEWDNFFALRLHGAAEPHMRDLAREIWNAHEGAKPQELKPGHWHTPFAGQADLAAVRLRADELRPQRDTFEGRGGGALYHDAGVPFHLEANRSLLRLSSARCASTSYMTVEGYDMTQGRADSLHDRLATAEPIHASPFEHVAQADHANRVWSGMDQKWEYRYPDDHRNFRGFRQYRSFIERKEDPIVGPTALRAA